MEDEEYETGWMYTLRLQRIRVWGTPAAGSMARPGEALSQEEGAGCWTQKPVAHALPCFLG